MRRGLLSIAIAMVALGAGAAPAAAAPSDIANDTRWLESIATSGETDKSGNQIRVSMIVKHDRGAKVTHVKVDDDWGGENSSDKAALSLTSPPAGLTATQVEQPTFAEGFNYTRVTFQYQISTSGGGLSCPTIGSGTNRTNKPISVRAITNDPQTADRESAPATATIDLSRVDCNLREDYPYVYGWAAGNRATTTPGGTVTFKYTGDDADTDNDFAGIRYRLRRLNDGRVFTPTSQYNCHGSNPDNKEHTLANVPFNERGRWVVEAELLNSCTSSSGSAPNGGRWYWIGAVDVNSAQGTSPTLSLTANTDRPHTGANVTITANAADSADTGTFNSVPEGGAPQAIEWDLNGDDVFEEGTLGSGSLTGGGLTSNSLTTAEKQIVAPAGSQAPGTYRVNARVLDNGAINGADSARRTATSFITYTVNSRPVAPDQSLVVDAGNSLPVTLSASDANDDPSTFSITDGPDHGTLSGDNGGRIYTPEAGYAGLDSFTYQANDGFGGTDTGVVTIAVHPATTLNGPSGLTSDSTPEYTFTSQNGATFECQVDGGAFEPCTSPQEPALADGPHTFTVRATSATGGLVERAPLQSKAVTVDSTAPDTTIDVGPDDPDNDTTPTFEFSSNEPTGATFECKLDGGDWEECDEGEITYPEQGDGPHTFYVRAADAAGNQDQTAAEHAWDIDTDPPATTIDSGPQSPTADNDPQFTFHSDEDPATFECRLDEDGQWGDCDSPHDLSDVADGEHTFYVRATDEAGNVEPTPAEMTWVTDATGPDTSFTAKPAQFTKSRTAKFEWSSDEAHPPVTYECRFEGGPWEDDCGTEREFTDLADGEYTFEVRGTDDLGNVEDPAASHTWTVDNVAPESSIQSGPPAFTSSKSATFEFSSTEPGTFKCRVDGGIYQPCTSPKTYTNRPDGLRVFEVQAVDRAGNVEQMPSQHIWVVDTDEPETTIVSSPGARSNDTSPSFSISSDEQPHIDRIECKLDDGDWEPCVEGPSGSQPWTINYPDVADGEHTFMARAVDRSGVVDSTPAEHTWVIDSVPADVVIDDAPDDPTNSTDAHFAFHASEPNTQMFCQIDGSQPTMCTNGEYDASSLTEGEHTFSVVSVDEAGNGGGPFTHEWTVDTTAPDTTIDTPTPDDPTDSNDATFALSSTESNSSFECQIDDGNWSPCDSGDEFSDLPDGSRAFRVRATDAAGNTDTTPAAFTWTIDTTNPGATIKSGPADPTKETSATFDFEADEDATFECSLDGADYEACDSGDEFTRLSEGEHTFEVRATDTVGNVGDPDTHAWTIDTTAPTTTIDVRPPNESNSRAAHFEFSADEDATFQCQIDGEPWTGCDDGTADYTDLADGDHTFRVRATDAAGNQEDQAVEDDWTIDATAPDTKIDAGPVGAQSSNDQTFEFSSADSDASHFQCKLDADWYSCSSPETLNDIPDGSYTFQVRAIDEFGNADPAPASLQFSIDTTAPDVTLDAKPAQHSNTAVQRFEFSSAHTDVATYQCDVDDANAWGACESPQDLTLNDGSHKFEVRATDRVGNTGAPTTYEWDVDTIDPETSLDTAQAGNAGDATFEFSSPETSGITFECQLNDGDWEPCASPEDYNGLADGDYTFRVRAKDQAGNVDDSPEDHTWTVDNTGPTVTLTAAPSERSNASTASFDWTTESGATVMCALDGDVLADCEPKPKDYELLGEGSHTWEIQATDSHGNVGTKVTHTWSVDLTEPETAIDAGPAEDSHVNTDQATFDFSSEAGATFTCKLDDEDWASCGSPRELTGLSDGPHTFSVRARDDHGNVDGSPATRKWTVDTQAPTSTITSNPDDDNAKDRDRTVSWTANEDGTTFQCRFTGGVFEDCGNSRSFTDLADGDYKLEVRATDRAGNVEDPPAGYEWTVDNAAPQTALIAPTGRTKETGATVEFTLEPGATFECKLDDGDFGACTSPETYSDLGDGPHSVEVRATDEAGNVEDPAQASTWTVDTQAPATALTAPTGHSNDNTPDISFGSTDGDLTRFECSLDGADFAPCTSPQTPTLGDGEHSFRVRAVDDVGNTESPDQSATWTVDTDNPEAKIDEAPAPLTRQNDATFKLSSDEPTGAQFDCKLDAGTFEDCDAGTKSYDDVADGNHRFTVKTTDRAGNTDEAEHEWAVDTVGPVLEVTKKPSGIVNSDSAGFEWNVNDNSAVVRCAIDGGPVDDCDSPQTFSDLDDGEHTVTITAEDLAGNQDSDTTTWVSDTGPPETTIDAAPAAKTTATSATFRFSSENGAKFECKLDSGSFQACTSPKSYTGLGVGSHQFSVRATDAAGNVEGTPATRTWRIDEAPAPRPNQPQGPRGGGEPVACSFAAPGPNCGPASLTASLSPRKAARNGSLRATVSGNGVELRAAVIQLPKGTALKAARKARRKKIGTLSFETLGSAGAIAPATLRLPRRGKTVLNQGGVKVVLKTGGTGRITITGLPANVTGVTVALNGKRTGLVRTPRRCATLAWGATLTDTAGNNSAAEATSRFCRRRSRR